MSRRQSLLLSPVSSESQAPCGGAGKPASANSLSRCLKGQGFPELRASTWVSSAKAGTGRPIKPEPALEEAAHLWPGTSGRNPCPLQLRCSAASAGHLCAARTPRPRSQQVPHAPHGSGESPHLSSVSDFCLASGPQMTQTCIFLSRHFADCFPASGFVLLPPGEHLAYTGPRGSSLEAGPTSVPTSACPPAVSLLSLPVCLSARPAAGGPGWQRGPSRPQAWSSEPAAWRGNGAAVVAGASLPAESAGLAPGTACSRGAHSPLRCLMWGRCGSLSIWTEQAVRPLFQALFFFLERI